MSHFFNILVHHSLVPALRECERSRQRQVQRTLENLQLGSWHGGTRVKVLKGVRKLVYEARINRSLRLLFTVVRAFAPRPPHALEHYLLAWDIVDHDHIDRARRMNLQPETGFLDFEPVLETELTEAPLSPEALVDQTPANPAELEQMVNDPARANETTDELTESIRWFELDPDIVIDEDEWQALLDDPGAGDFELKLSLEQAETIYEPGPVLLRGTAGSGKTTVCIYRLARAAVEEPGSRLLLVTYSRPLLTAAQRLFRDLFRARRQPLPETLPDFYSFPQLYHQLIGDRQEAINLMRYPLFEQWYGRIYGRQDGALAWEEIRGIIKGAQLDLNKDALSQADYEQLGRKRAPIFVNQRPRLYQVFLKYQAWCRQAGYLDDIDLARRALRCLRQQPERRYDQVICDEGQDLTELELRFLLELSRDRHSLLFTADPQQIVNPSGFRWAELRSLLRDEQTGQTPDIYSLTRNYRSVHSIVALSNALITIQRERTGRSDDDDLQETTLHGASPVLVTGTEEAVIDQLRGFGPRCAVITGSAEEAERLSQFLESERVFDIAGAKGLEFDGCVLWGIMTHDHAIWAAIFDPEANLKEDPVTRRAIHHLYVAVTRPRRYLGIYEPDPRCTALWQQPVLRSLLEHDTAEALGKFMLFAASPAEWAAEGDYFLDRGRYRQAAECYRRAGDEHREQLAAAAFDESIGNYGDAADRFLALGYPERAAPCLERDGRFRQAADAFFANRQWPEAGQCYERAKALKRAAEAYQNANHTDDYRRCLRAYHEKQRNWAEAAKVAEKQNDLEGASNLYMKGGHRERALAMRLEQARVSQDDEAIVDLLRRGGKLAEAAEHLRQAGNLQEAQHCEAEAAERRQDFEAAAALWRQLNDPHRALNAEAAAAETNLDWLRAAEIYHKLRQQKQVTTCLRRATEPKARIWLEALQLRRSNPLRAAELFAEINFQEEARRLIEVDFKRICQSTPRPAQADPGARSVRLRKINERFMVYDAYDEKGADGLAECDIEFVATGQLLAELYLREDLPEKAVRALADVNLYKEAAELAQAHGLTTQVHRYSAASHQEQEEWKLAADHFLAYGNEHDHAKCMARHLEQEGQLLEAADWYEKCRMTAQARRCRQEAGELF